MIIDKIGNSNVKIDPVQNRITFLDTRFYQTDSGDFVPSVTSILDAYPKGAAYYEWLKKNGEDSDEIRDDAGRRGSVVHNLTERYDKGEEVSLFTDTGDIGMKVSEWKMFERYVEFRSRHPFEIEQIEQNYVSDQLGYAGTIDRIINMNGERILLDIKTSNAIYPSYWLQLAAYNQLVTKAVGYNPVDKVGIIWLNAKTRTYGKGDVIQGPSWQLVTKDDTDQDLKLFNATHQLWLAENGGMKPRQTTYSITHKL